MNLKRRIAAYRELTKGGIVTLVLISVLGGYVIARSPEIEFGWSRLIWTLIGLLLVASGSSALNQLQEQGLDARMERTRKRPLPSGLISAREATIAIVLLIGVGLAVLYEIDPKLSLWWKRSWAFAAVPGAIPGALPIWMGALAANGSLGNPVGVYLFAILFFWQMPHFWSLAIRYRDDYKMGGIPTLPVAHGVPVTVRQIALWTLAYVALLMGAPLFLKVGMTYQIGTLIMVVWVLWELLRFWRAYGGGREEKSAWLRFFLVVNFSLIGFLALASADLWSVYLTAWWHSR